MMCSRNRRFYYGNTFRLLAIIRRYQFVNFIPERVNFTASPLQIQQGFFFKRALLYQRRVQSADGLVGVDTDLSGLFFELRQQEDFVIMRDFHLMNSRKNEQPDQAGRTLFFGDKRVPNFFFYSERLMDHSHSYLHD